MFDDYLLKNKQPVADDMWKQFVETEPKKKVFGDKPFDTRTFQQYDKSNPIAQEQIGKQAIMALTALPNNPYHEQAERKALQNTAEALTDPTMAFIAYHGSPKQGMEKILQEGKIKPWREGSGLDRVSAGIDTEGGLIWASKEEKYGDWYASGGEAGMLKEVEPGATFKIDIPDSAKLIDRHEPLTEAQRKILNEKFIPHYKPLREGDTLSSAESKANGVYGLEDFLRALEYDGITYGKGQVGILSEVMTPLEVKPHKGLWEKLVYDE